jgi:hypothetical protein
MVQLVPHIAGGSPGSGLRGEPPKYSTNKIITPGIKKWVKKWVNAPINSLTIK